jgi:hypothetical protein
MSWLAEQLETAAWTRDGTSKSLHQRTLSRTSRREMTCSLSSKRQFGSRPAVRCEGPERRSSTTSAPCASTSSPSTLARDSRMFGGRVTPTVARHLTFWMRTALNDRPLGAVTRNREQQGCRTQRSGARDMQMTSERGPGLFSGRISPQVFMMRGRGVKVFD